MRLRGLTLIELIVSCALFLSLSVLVFVFFRYGTRSFQKANQKHGLQTDALRSMESLQAELKRSSLASIYLENGTAREMSVEGTTVRRDAIAFATLKNWSDKTSSENFDLETGAPKWNRYWMYYATMEENGRFIRLKVDPNPPPEAPMRLLQEDFDRLYYDNPNTNTFDGATPPFVLLAKNVFNFSVDQTPSGGAFEVSFKLREKHLKDAVESGERRPFDFYELQLTITPENSFPNDL